MQVKYGMALVVHHSNLPKNFSMYIPYYKTFKKQNIFPANISTNFLMQGNGAEG